MIARIVESTVLQRIRACVLMSLATHVTEVDGIPPRHTRPVFPEAIPREHCSPAYAYTDSTNVIIYVRDLFGHVIITPKSPTALCTCIASAHFEWLISHNALSRYLRLCRCTTLVCPPCGLVCRPHLSPDDKFPVSAGKIWADQARPLQRFHRVVTVESQQAEGMLE